MNHGNSFKKSLTLIVAVAGGLSLCLAQSALAGSPVAWGYNVYGQCDVPAGTDFNTIAAGSHHSLAIKNDGSLAAWGRNNLGQCGDILGGAQEINDVWYSNTSDFVAAAGGGNHSLALKVDGSLAAWGWNDDGQCNVPASADFVGVAAAGNHSLALKNDGSLAAWGWNDFDQCSDIPGGAYKIGDVWYSDSNDFDAVAAGTYHSLALKADGSLAAWGRNSHGQRDVPAGSDFVAVAGGDYHSLALKADGSLAAWGANYYGQRNVPDGNDFVAIAAGGDHGLALKADGSLAVWGSNIYGQCSDIIPGGAYEINNVWYSNSADFVAVAACNQQSLAIVAEPVCTSGDLLVNSYLDRNVSRYDRETGSFKGVFIPTRPHGLSWLVFGPDGNLYAPEHQNDEVLRFSGTTGEFLGTFVESGAGGLDGPAGLVFGRDCNLYVVSNHNHRVLQYNGRTGEFIKEFVLAGSGGLNGATGLEFGPDGNLYVCSTVTDNVLRYNGATGEFMNAFVSTGAGGLDAPWDLEFGPDDNLYVSSYLSDEVLRYDGKTGQFMAPPFVPSGCGLDQPQGLTFGCDDNLYVAGSLSNNVIRSDGTKCEVFITGLNNPETLVFFPEPPCWQEQAKLLASDGTAYDWFGIAVSISGDYAIVGADGDDDKANWAGSAYIFKRQGDNWVEQAPKLLASDGAAGDRFGWCVSISGDYAIAGAHCSDACGTDSGSAYIFEREGENWIEQAKLTASDGAALDYFGISVSVSGDYAIVGAYQDDNENGTDSGSAYVFEKPTSGWVDMAEKTKLTASDGTPGDRFGFPVSISGDYAIVGAYASDACGTDSGSAYIFKREGENWIEQARLTASDGAAGDYFGESISISGDYAIVGAGADDNAGTDSGSAYIFKRDGENWVEQAKLTASDSAAYDYFGDVSISGNYAVVGALGDDSESGSAYIFKREGANWTQQAKLFACDRAVGDRFGLSCVIDGNHVIVGAAQNSDNGTWSGSAYVFENICVPKPTLVDIDIKPGSYPNAINLGSHGLIPVAILSSEEFDATTVDPETVELSGSGVAVRGKSNKYMAHKEDVNEDGLIDLVVQVATENLDPDSFQDGYAVLTGTTFDGKDVEGEDEITIVPPEQ